MAARYDAVVIGSGPNGLVAAIELARAGRSVLVVEGAAVAGGGTRTEELTQPGFRHDVCSTVHPLGLASPALRDLPLAAHGVRWVQPDAPLAHALDGGAAVLEYDTDAMATRLGRDGHAWRELMDRVVGPGFALTDALLDPLSVPRHPIALARYGMAGVQGATRLLRRFDGAEAPALLAGCAAHSMLPLDAPGTGGFGLLLAGLAHLVGWPFAAGGSQSIADALVAILREHGGEIETGRWVERADQLPPSRVVLADTSPSMAVRILGDRVPASYARRLRRFRRGPGVFKIDWALDGPVPWTHAELARAATVHLGGTADEVAAAEADVAAGRHPERPFVLTVQASLFDPSRVPDGCQSLWAYCHVPNGSTVDMTDAIERQVERFAPGFRDRIRARHTMDTVAVERHDPNDLGGDINGGSADVRQFVFRPTVSLRPWKLPAPGWYLCSSSIPPGGGVHGMCGRKAARSALANELR